MSIRGLPLNFTGIKILREINGRSMLTILRKCEINDLQAVLLSCRKTLVICDVEGYEVELLNPELIPELAHTHILVELHETAYPGVEELIKSRFHKTHIIEQIWAEERTLEELPYQSFFTQLFPKRYLAKYTVSEMRPQGMSWLWMKAIEMAI